MNVETWRTLNRRYLSAEKMAHHYSRETDSHGRAEYRRYSREAAALAAKVIDAEGSLRRAGFYRRGSTGKWIKRKSANPLPVGRYITKRNPTTIAGWVRAKAVKIVRNKAGKAVSVKIKT